MATCAVTFGDGIKNENEKLKRIEVGTMFSKVI